MHPHCYHYHGKSCTQSNCVQFAYDYTITVSTRHTVFHAITTSVQVHEELQIHFDDIFKQIFNMDVCIYDIYTYVSLKL